MRICLDEFVANRNAELLYIVPAGYFLVLTG